MTTEQPRIDAEPTQRLRVALIDDEIVYRDHMLSLDDARVVFAYAFPNVEALMREPIDVDVVVLDMHIKPTDGVAEPLVGAQAISAVKALDKPIVIYTSEHRATVLAGCLALGVGGIASKVEGPDKLVEAVTKVAAGEFVISPAISGLAYVFARRGLLPALRPAWVPVLQARARGETNKEIALRLGYSEGTVEQHTNKINTAVVDFLRQIAGAPAEVLRGLPDPDAVRHSASRIESMLGLGPGDLLAPPRKPNG